MTNERPADLPERLRIVIPGDDPPHIQESPHLQRLEPYGEVALYTTKPRDTAEQLERVHDAEVILNSRSELQWPREVLEQLPRLRLISTTSIGVDNIDLEAAREMGITVCHQGGNTSPIVGEHQFALMMGVAKRLAEHTQRIREGRWGGAWDHVWLTGKTVGVIGTGRTGAEMARLCNAIGMTVIAWTANPSEERARELGVRFVEFDGLLATADVVSLHVPLTPQTHHLISTREFGLMKDGAILVNGARGAVVDTEALMEALGSGKLHGAGLDVFEEEPLPADSPLLAFDNVVLTPHMADGAPEGLDFLNRDAVDHIIAWLDGEPRNVVV